MPIPAAAPGGLTRSPLPGASGRRRFALRTELPAWQAVLMALAGIVRLLRTLVVRDPGAPEERIISPSKGLSQPGGNLRELSTACGSTGRLTRNLLTTLRRLCSGLRPGRAGRRAAGRALRLLSRGSSLLPADDLFGRNIPVAALIPLTFSLFGIGELQKMMFIFIACVAFVVMDTTRAIEEVGSQYIDTAYTLGAGTWQTIGKVLVPLALPSIFNSLRLMFGLAFGYIMLAEVVKFGGETGGLGDIINISQRRGPREHVLLILLIIPVVALVIDRLFFFVQAELFPYRYGGNGILHRLVRGVLHAWEDLRLAALEGASKACSGGVAPGQRPTDPHTP